MFKFNMKKIVLSLLIVMAAAYLLCGLVMIVSPKSVFNLEKSSYSIKDEKKSDISGIDEININTSSTTINILPTDESELKARFYGDIISTSNYQKPELECYTEGSRLYVNIKTKPTVIFGIHSLNTNFDVYVPKSYKKALSASTSSGGIQIKDLTLSDIKFNSSSGSASLDNVICESFTQNSSSGSLRANGLKTNSTKTSTSSGSRKLTNFTGDLTVNSSSGGTYVEYSEFNNDIKVNSSSGSVKILLPSNAGFTLEAAASSGGIDCDFPITVTEKVRRNLLKGTVGNGENSIVINTTSGGINIEK